MRFEIIAAINGFVLQITNTNGETGLILCPTEGELKKAISKIVVEYLSEVTKTTSKEE